MSSLFHPIGVSLSFMYDIPKAMAIIMRITAIIEFTPMKILLNNIFLILRKRPLVTSIGEKLIARLAGTIPDTRPVVMTIAIIIGTERHVRRMCDISNGASIIPIIPFNAGVTATISSTAPTVHIALIIRLSVRC